MALALLGALLIGTSLGLMGSGGSILTVPVLIYLLGQDEKIAIAGSLWVVGTIALVSGLRGAWLRQVDWSNVVWFGLPGMLGTYLGAMLGGRVASSAQLLTFVGVLTLAGIWMLRRPGLPAGRVARAPARIVVDGLVVGTLTGFVGVGGGFLIVPALVLMGGLTMQRAVGSSLVIIAMNSFTGFLKYRHVLAERDLHLDWAVLATLAGVGVVGSLAGGILGRRLDQRRLRRAFAVLLLATAAAMGATTIHGLVRSHESGSGAVPNHH
ncbi:MAG: sulfite exporter TauE/SafE family protein [Planctomycetota bacterium]